jgi:hypothetical protein
MTSFSEIGTTVLLVTLTLWLQCAGLGALIRWTRRAVYGDLPKLGPFRSALLIMQLSTAVIVLHGATLGRLLSLALLPILGIGDLLFGEQLCNGRLR